MILFACKQCGKKYRQPVEAAGTMVFCVCGQGNRVPWESTLLESEMPAEEKPKPSGPPVLEPAGPDEGERDWPRRRLVRERPVRRRDPAYCLNHDDTPSQHTCSACGEAFCAKCVVALQDRTLCGPCKNFQIDTLQRPPRVSALAIVAAILAVLSLPVAFCLTNISYELQKGPSLTLLFGFAGLLLPTAALVLGLKALQQADADPRIGGKGLAVTGVMVALVGVLWCVTISFLQVARLLIE